MKTALLDRKPICNDFVWWRVELSTVDRFSLGMDHYLFKKGKRGGGGGVGNFEKQISSQQNAEKGKGIHEKIMSKFSLLSRSCV